jgi:Trk K+ transport system NAD-binding subunit
MTICSLFKYTKKPSFLTANSLAQVGEFSLIIAAQGLLLGHVSQEFVSLVVIVTLASFIATPYYIQYSEQLYRLMKKPLKVFDVFTTKGLEYLPNDETKTTVVLCGYNRIGYSVVKGLKDLKKKLLVVDFNPEIIDKLIKREVHCIYGDVTDDEIRAKMDLPHIKMLISTIPRVEDSLLLIHAVREVNKKTKIIVTASDMKSCLRLYEAGADYVVMPHFLGGTHISNVLNKMKKEKKTLDKEKEKHIQELEERKDLGHEHPKHH